ncbi:MAG: hypothetical protein ACXWX1_12620 [Aeromicrobium sp.]
MIFEFDSGRTVFITNGNPTLTNLATGRTFDHKARFHVVDTYNPQTNEIVEVTTGQVNGVFWPGDQGPWGVVSYPGRMLRFTGNTRTTFDVDSESITSFSYSGQVMDVCAALAG